MIEESKGAPELPVATGWKMVTSFFVLPLIIVLGSVGVFYLFGKLTQYQKSPEEYLTELVSSNSHKRWQAAFELSRYVIQKNGATLSPEFEDTLIKTFETSHPEEQKLRTYLTIVLAHIGQQKSSSLFEKVVDTSPSTEDQIYALWALGKLGSTSSAPIVEKKLQSTDAGIRKTAAFSIGFVGGKTNVPALEHLLKDDINDVRWNAALSLAQLGNSSGKQEILNLLDENYLPTNTPTLRQDERLEIVISALNASMKIRLVEAKESVEKWSKHTNPRVQKLALQALEQFGSKL